MTARAMAAPETTGRRRGPAPALLLAGVIVLAAALRTWRLGQWGFEGDEIHTLRDSLALVISNPRPLLYLLNYYVVRPLMPLDELGLRLLPALFGILAVPAFYLIGRRLVGSRAALFGALLLAVNPYQVNLSQYARYWSLVFLLSAVYPFAIYLGVRDRDRRALALGIVTGLLAMLAHPASVLLVGGLGLFLVTQLHREHWRELWGRRSVRWGTIIALVLAGATGARLWGVLHNWIFERPGPGFQVSDHLLRAPAGAGGRQIALALSYTDGLTLPLAVVGTLGIYLLWQGRHRPLALLLTCLFAFPIAFIFLLQLNAPVSRSYLVPSMPVFFIGAGVFLDRLCGVEWEFRPRWLLPATVTALIIAAGAPTLISQYRNGSRNDFRGAARWLDQQLAPGDIVFSDQFRVMGHYLAKARVKPLSGNPAPLDRSLRDLHDAGRAGTLWLVAPAASHAFRTYQQDGSLIKWIYDNCQLRNTVGVGRLDFRQQYLQIYRCPPAAAESYGDVVGARASPFRDSTSR